MYIPSCIHIIIFCFCFAFFHFPFFCQAGGQSAWDMLNEEKFSSSITTSCVDLDNILGGGINCKEVTEIGD
jgi:hypothetical protein